MPSPLQMLGAFALAVALSAGCTGLALRLLRRLAGRQHIREDVPETHQAKAGTPSMGGIPMLLALVAACAVGGAFTGALTARMALWLGVAVAYALIGLADDLRKLGDRRSRGIPARYRVGAEVLLAAGFFAGLRGLEPDMAGYPWWWGTASWPAAQAACLAVLAVVGGSNALNLTDGLDGLAAGLSALAGLALATIALGLGLADLAVCAVCVAGVAAGFLLWNARPARVWMGDVGSLGLGAALGGIAVAARVELLYVVIGLVFVAEALSVIMQVISFKLTGRRIFRMSPLHHHFELGGLSEARIVVGFWVVGALAAVAGVALFWRGVPVQP